MSGAGRPPPWCAHGPPLVTSHGATLPTLPSAASQRQGQPCVQKSEEASVSPQCMRIRTRGLWRLRPLPSAQPPLSFFSAPSGTFVAPFLVILGGYVSAPRES